MSRTGESRKFGREYDLSNISSLSSVISDEVTANNREGQNGPQEVIRYGGQI
jgi:hypothetical protein